MQLEARERLQHVIGAADEIQRYTAGKTFADYTNDDLLPYAIERLFMIIGEALRKAARLDPDIASRITGYRQIIAFRNILVHGYATVYDEGVWTIIHEGLPLLLTEVRALLTPTP